MATDTYNTGMLHSKSPGDNWTGVSIDNTRRIFGIGDRVSELSPEQSLFFTYLTKVSKQSIDDTVWKPLEYRHQWQRRNFVVDTTLGTVTSPATTGTDEKVTITGVKLQCNYNKYGKVTSGLNTPVFIVENAMVALEVMPAGSGAVETKNFKVTAIDSSTGVATLVSVDTFSDAVEASLATFDGAKGQVIGSQWSEGSQAPDGWTDELSDTEFYSQIFKTSVPLMSGSAMATRYRGYANEWKRIYSEHVMAHKMDIEHAMLFGKGAYYSQDDRYSWGIVPFIKEKGGKIYNMDYDGAVASGDYGVGVGKHLPFTYDGVVDLMEDFMSPEAGNSGQKLVLTSRKVIAKMSKLGANSFVANSLGDSGTSPFRANLDVKPSKFAPVDVTSLGTSFGSLNFVAHPLFRGQWEDIAAVVDLSNVKYRPLAANGQNRDTFVETNIQDNSTDGRKDQIITEAGLEVNLPETHALINFSDNAG